MTDRKTEWQPTVREPMEPAEAAAAIGRYDSAERIAQTVADLKARRVRLLNQRGRILPNQLLDRVVNPTVVDCTAIYRSIIAKDEPIYMYEDHPSIAPPFDEAVFGYVNEHGNVVVMHCFDQPDDRWDNEPGELSQPIDFDVDVRWRLQVVVWINGRGNPNHPVMTTGPTHMWRMAIGHDGEPLDIRWVQLLADYDMDNWDNAACVTLGALNFLNCANVEAVEPSRPRPQRRRIVRTGVTVNEIVVAKPGKSVRSVASGDPAPTPLSSVRGHFAHYGPKYGRKLLFGKLEGRYWIPQHARGSADVGETHHTYRVET